MLLEHCGVSDDVTIDKLRSDLSDARETIKDLECESNLRALALKAKEADLKAAWSTNKAIDKARMEEMAKRDELTRQLAECQQQRDELELYKTTAKQFEVLLHRQAKTIGDLTDKLSAAHHCEQVANESFAELSRQLAEAEQQRDELVAELQNIANAKTSAWEPDVRDQFEQWAKSRARAALAKVGAGGTAS